MAAAIFLAALGPADRPRFEPLDVDGWLGRAIAEARARFPEVAIDDDDFVRFLAGKAAALPDAGAAIAKLHTSDLFLALGCLGRDAAAIARFESIYAAPTERTLARAAPGEIDDLWSLLREQLFFGREGRRPLIGDYSGRGELVHWLRSIALRAALRTRERDDRHVDADAALGAVATAENPEIEYLRRRHAALFEEALRRALLELSPRERNLLRQHYLDGLNIDALGQLYRVHRATAARWVGAARESVLDAVKEALAAHLSPSEVESFLRATKGEIELRISRVLKVEK